MHQSNLSVNEHWLTNMVKPFHDNFGTIAMDIPRSVYCYGLHCSYSWNSFKPFRIADILKMDNLWQFKNLVKLQMDNNIIERIEGLKTLTNLAWLGESDFEIHLQMMQSFLWWICLWNTSPLWKPLDFVQFDGFLSCISIIVYRKNVSKTDFLKTSWACLTLLLIDHLKPFKISTLKNAHWFGTHMAIPFEQCWSKLVISNCNVNMGFPA